MLLRPTAFALGIASAWACRAPGPDQDCPQGSDGCACAFGFCDDGLTCVADVCTPDTATSDTTALVTTESPSTSGSSSTSDAESSSSDTSGADESSSSGEPPSTDPIITAIVDGVPSSYDIDPHAYNSPAGTLLVVGSESGGQGADLIIRIPPIGPGTYECVLEEIDVAIYWTIQGPMGPLELSTRTSGDCTITVEEAGEVGGFVTGTFEGVVRWPGAAEIPPVTITEGVFHVLHTEPK
ncbi:MAG TPA: hypothetical protein VG755_37470 [Nannocystaceae bacterium]|nr:hypothetical protein [Nannocystaceae bacterium]